MGQKIAAFLKKGCYYYFFYVDDIIIYPNITKSSILNLKIFIVSYFYSFLLQIYYILYYYMEVFYYIGENFTSVQAAKYLIYPYKAFFPLY
jgi:hypothetical protein